MIVFLGARDMRRQPRQAPRASAGPRSLARRSRGSCRGRSGGRGGPARALTDLVEQGSAARPASADLSDPCAVFRQPQDEGTGAFVNFEPKAGEAAPSPSGSVRRSDPAREISGSGWRMKRTAVVHPTDAAEAETPDARGGDGFSCGIIAWPARRGGSLERGSFVPTHRCRPRRSRSC